jgi:hypothetical protein
MQAFLLAARAAVVPVAAAFWAALGTFWTIFAWYHQEIVVPSTAPVNLTTEVTLEDVGTGTQTTSQQADQFEAIQLSVVANNVSGRNVYLLSNYWDAWGGKVELQTKVAKDDLWLREVNRTEELQRKSGVFRYPTSGKYYKISTFERVAWGNIFPATYFLYPKETVSASVIFFIPRDIYDLLHVEVHIPTTEKQDAVQVSFLIDEGRVKPKYSTVESNGSWKEVVEQKDIAALPIQETQSRKQLALWRNEPLNVKPISSKNPFRQ